MSMEDFLFGSDLEDSEDEGKSAKESKRAERDAELNELFGDSPSEGEDEGEPGAEASESDHEEQAESGDENAKEGTNIAQGKNEEDEEGDDDENDDENEKEVTKSKLQSQVSSADLFGDDEELSSDEEEHEEKEERLVEQQEEQVEDGEDIEARDANEIPHEEEEEEETRIDVTIPYCQFSLGSELYFVKMPNFLSIEHKPFDPALYEDEMEEDEVLDEEGRARLKLKVENTIRWRYRKDEEGNEIKESNARIVRWSDGTTSLLLGEVFDVHKNEIDGNCNHLFVQQGTGLQGQAVFKEKLTFRPHSTTSQTHRKMTLSIADRASKAQKIRILPAAGMDPEAQRSELIKKEDERLRALLRRENQQRRIKERHQAKGLSASFLEPDRYEDDGEDLEQSLLAIKKKYKKKLAEGFPSESDEAEESDEGAGGLESEEDEEGKDRLLNAKEGDDNDLEGRKRTSSEGGGSQRKKKKSRQIVESDEDSD
ncbi:unnamed protein product [Pocillopora meandrina]|uniref:RNA polymerase-associated protein LEO1 n=1 Tax=Pocillopora meandrina TaxID=46732 RepID=A0AAU9WZ55_9CNID|nr:unnamed protein product [Pocillopora meandrina]